MVRHRTAEQLYSPGFTALRPNLAVTMQVSLKLSI